MSSPPEGTGPPPPRPAPTSLETNARKANEVTRKRSPFMFAVIGLCFFLPFISISCSGQRLATLSGVQLVTGAEVDVDEEALTEDFEDFFGPSTDPTDDTETPAPTEESDPSVWAIMALAAAVIGVVVGLVLKERRRSIGSLAVALLGLVGLIGLRFDLQGDVSEAEGLVQVDYRMGYWISALLFVVLAIAHGTFVRSGGGAPTDGSPPAPGP